MKQNRMALMAAALVLVLCCASTAQSAEPKKGLLVYDTIYGSTIEVAYWLKAIIGNEQPLDVKRLDQVVTVKPYDYVIIGSYSKWEKASPKIYKFIEKNQMELAQKQVCYFLLGGDWDETMLLKAPGAPIKLIAGRNYLFDIKEKFPSIKPIVIGGFGGRQVMPALNGPRAADLPTPTLKWRLRGPIDGALSLGGRVAAKAWVTPRNLAGPKPMFEIHQRVAGKWRWLLTVRRPLSATGAYSWTWAPKHRGVYKMFAEIGGTAAYEHTGAAFRVFRVK